MCRRLKAEAGPTEEDVAIPVETVPGEVAQVDFGYAGLRYDPDRGVLRKCWVFVMTLGFSRDIFCDLVFDQKIATWLNLHVRAFEYFASGPRSRTASKSKCHRDFTSPDGDRSRSDL